MYNEGNLCPICTIGTLEKKVINQTLSYKEHPITLIDCTSYDCTRCQEKIVSQETLDRILVMTNDINSKEDKKREEALALQRKEALALQREEASALQLEEALALLSERQRVYYVLRRYGRFYYREIAEICSVDIGTIKSTLSEARDKLSEVLSEAEINP
jgi:RNA polymerase sigma factor (sigma-70 family)